MSRCACTPPARGYSLGSASVLRVELHSSDRAAALVVGNWASRVSEVPGQVACGASCYALIWMPSIEPSLALTKSGCQPAGQSHSSMKPVPSSKVPRPVGGASA